jgi:hypothetical protein
VSGADLYRFSAASVIAPRDSCKCCFGGKYFLDGNCPSPGLFYRYLMVPKNICANLVRLFLYGKPVTYSVIFSKKAWIKNIMTFQ